MMRNILIINQPTNNRGDEAAHKSLVRELNKRFPSAKITVLFSNALQNSVIQMEVISPQNNYINIISFNKGAGFLKRWGLRLNIIKPSILHPAHRVLVKYIKEADIVICAPGGICMGLFQNWGHIYNLTIAMAYNKKIAYYSRSFGPFPIDTKWNRVFKRASYKLLKNFDFISIRDAKTMQIADEIGLSYVPSIDTAFLDTPKVDLPDDLRKLISNEEYIVFVPNTLTWHPAFKDCSMDYLDKFYLSIMELFLSEDENIQIVMLPQLFNRQEKGDETYFRKLKSKINNERIIIVPDNYSSDIQQTIISKAKLMIGARYHSIVFAINNEVPFVALSYEHKISGLLQILGLEKYLFDIEKLGIEQPDISKAINQIKKISATAQPNKIAKERAQQIAKECMNEFSNKYPNLLF